MTGHLEAATAQSADGLAAEYGLGETGTQPTMTAHATDHAGVWHLSMKGECR